MGRVLDKASYLRTSFREYEYTSCDTHTHTHTHHYTTTRTAMHTATHTHTHIPEGDQAKEDGGTSPALGEKEVEHFEKIAADGEQKESAVEVEELPREREKGREGVYTNQLAQGLLLVYGV